MDHRVARRPIPVGSASVLAAACGALMWPALSILTGAGCAVGGDGDTPKVTNFSFAPLAANDQLLAADVDAIIQAASESVDFPNLAIAITDRLGNILRVYDRIGGVVGAPDNVENNYATALARAAAYLSHSQAPLTSRTGQFLSTFHFPGVFDQINFSTAAPETFAGITIPIQPTLGISNTPQAPLWQIDASNRGGMDDIQAVYDPGLLSGETPPALTNPGLAFPVPTPGLGPIPGGVPLYKLSSNTGDVVSRLVGAIGVYAWDTDPNLDPRPDIGEFAAFSGSSTTNISNSPAKTDYNFGVIPFEGAVYLVGILLPYLDAPVQPVGTLPGPPHDAALEVCDGVGAACNQRADGALDAFSTVVGGAIVDALVPPTNSAVLGPVVGLSAGDVDAILRGCVRSSQQTHAAIRLPASSACQMIIAICDMDGTLLGVFREADATIFSLEISVSKARNAVFFSDPLSINADPASPLTTNGAPTAGMHPLFIVFGDGNFGDPSALPLLGAGGSGIAVTARSLGFLSQPFFPPTQDGSNIVGPLFSLANANRDAVNRFDGQGFETAPGGAPAQRSGIIFFPGSAPLYKNGILVGGIGVSGDGVEQDDFVTSQGIQFAEVELGIELEPPPAIRIDNFEYSGITIPYYKFPQNPNG